MPLSIRRRLVATCAPAAFALALALHCLSAKADADVLWHFIDERCVPGAIAKGPVKPCAEVDLVPDRAHGWVVIKDLRGRLQHLVLPTEKITGIENPGLESADATHYFSKAWAARSYLDKLNGKPLPRDVVSLTVNSQWSRSQNQLHIHISCVQPELRARLLAAQSEIGPSWSALQGGWLRHPWFVRRIDGPALDALNLFADVQANVPQARDDMSRQTLGVVAANFVDGQQGFVLMASRWDPADPSSGSAEDDVQDHGCAILER